jgi:hypothetical protein
MTHFLQMIETLRTNGLTFVGKEIVEYRNGKKSYNNSAINTRQLMPDEWALVEQCQPFVFYGDNEPVETQNSDTVVERFDPPFKVFSIECINGPVGRFRGSQHAEIGLYCIMVMELAPRQYQYFSLANKPHGGWMVARPDKHVAPIVEKFLARLSTEKLGTETVRTRVKIGTGTAKRVHTIRRIVHVAPKRLVRNLAVAGPTQQVNWTHRWTVRGHWVSLPGRIGKDRDGNYCVADWTWREGSIKGPEHLPLVKKVRAVEDGR